jgi:ribosomal protein L40E
MPVPNLWDKTPEAPSPSELNPLTNPILEQNLGRWAKVYFGTPPEKREQAVSNLLEQIKRESGSGAAAQPARPYFATDTRFQRAVCSACQHQNPLGHKFCSRCGQALGAGRTGSMDNLGTLRISEAPPANSANDLEWSQNPAFSSLDDSDPQNRGWKYLVGVAVIASAGFACLHWAPELRTLVSSRTATAPQVSAPSAAFPRENSSPAVAKNSAQATAPEPPESEGQNRTATAEARARTIAPTGIQPAAQKSPLLAATTSRQTVVDQGSSASDLRLAQRYLGGSMGVRDPSEAAKLLWKAVSKQNATAAVLLSDLYLRGDGVPRSCDQARLLLVAAAKRGSPLAAQQLRNLESQGCH